MLRKSDEMTKRNAYYTLEEKTKTFKELMRETPSHLKAIHQQVTDFLVKEYRQD